MLFFVYTVIEEIPDMYGNYTGKWSKPEERADYTYHPNGYECFFPHHHVKIQAFKCISFGYGEPRFALSEIQNAIDYAAEHNLGEETMLLLRAAHELGIDTAPSIKFAI